MIGINCTNLLKLKVNRATARDSISNVFLVEIPNTRLTNINRINTWLTCDGENAEWGCPSVIGTDNIRIKSGENLKFAVQIQRGGYLPGFDRYARISEDEARKIQYQLHYEVEGPCA